MIIKAEKYGIIPGEHKMLSYRLIRLIQDAKRLTAGDAVEIQFQKGIYHFYPDFASESLLYISNHDEDTIKRVAFLFEDLHNVTIQGNDSLFLFHTEIIPFVMRNCHDVNLKGISIDYIRTAYSEAIIEEISPERMILRIDPERYPHIIRRGRIYFYGENFCCEPTGWLEMDRDRNAPVYGGKDMDLTEQSGIPLRWKCLESGLVECTIEDKNLTFSDCSEIGNYLIIRHHPRSHPAIYIVDSQRINLEKITIFHAVGMGVIAVRTSDILLDSVHVKRNPDTPRVFTACADATHFVLCDGKITIKNGLFENQLDDPVNIHGIYAKVNRVLEEKEILLDLVHHQHKGVEIGKCGDRISFLDPESMLPYAENSIQDIQMINKDRILLKCSDKVLKIKPGTVVENISIVPEVLIENCHFRNNRARGVLLTGRGTSVVRGNIFEVPGAAILVEGDMNEWFESGAIKNILVENNTFCNCAYIPEWGRAPIQVTPMAKKFTDCYFHQNLFICNNRFLCFDHRILFARNIKNITFLGNQITDTKKYPPIEGEKYHLEHVGNFCTSRK